MTVGEIIFVIIVLIVAIVGNCLIPIDYDKDGSDW